MIEIDETKILVADSGSTKTDWLLLDLEGRDKPIPALTKGINPYFLIEGEIRYILYQELLPPLNDIETIGKMFFYGAGCNAETASRVVNIMDSMFCGEVFVGSDMLGAARATCGTEAGIACILGTGSNSCFYDGENIAANVPPLGFILGDEGGGASLGRHLISDIYKGTLSAELKEQFAARYRLTVEQILDRVYREPFPNKFLAEFTYFIADNIEHPDIHSLVLNDFRLFLKRNVKQYDYQNYPVHFVGSVAHIFREILIEAAEAEGITIAKILQKPITALAEYHLRHCERPLSCHCDPPLSLSSDPPLFRHCEQSEAIHSPEPPENQEETNENQEEDPEEFPKKPLKPTEQPSYYNDLEKQPTRDLLEAINTEDSKVPAAVKKVIPLIVKLVDEIVDRINKGGRVYYIGAGTSGRLGVLDASEIPPTYGVSPDLFSGVIAGGNIALRTSVEFAEDNIFSGWNELKERGCNKNDVVIGISASGSTPYVRDALFEARMEGAYTACITNNPNSTIAYESVIAIEIDTGPEFVTGSTRMKAGTSQKLVLNMISTAAMIRLGRVKGNRMVNMQLKNNKLLDRGVRIIVDEYRIAFEKAQQLLAECGSVQEAFKKMRKSKDETP